MKSAVFSVYSVKFELFFFFFNKDDEVYATSLYVNGLSCLNIIEATDRVQVALKISNTVNDIWTNSRCEGDKSILFCVCAFRFNRNE
jgi:hypothetical protein